MRILFMTLFLLSIISCKADLMNEADKKLVGNYKKTVEDISYEILKLHGDYKLTSTYCCRLYGYEKIIESGYWNTNKDTLIIHRTRNELLKQDGYPTIEKFLIKKKGLVALYLDRQGRLVEEDRYFKRQLF